VVPSRFPVVRSTLAANCGAYGTKNPNYTPGRLSRTFGGFVLVLASSGEAKGEDGRRGFGSGLGRGTGNGVGHEALKQGAEFLLSEVYCFPAGTPVRTADDGRNP
jgi:hypothetical protein